MTLWRKPDLSTQTCAFTITISLYTNLFTTTTKPITRLLPLPRPEHLTANSVQQKSARPCWTNRFCQALSGLLAHHDETSAGFLHAHQCLQNRAKPQTDCAAVEKPLYIHRSRCAEQRLFWPPENLSTFRSNATHALFSW